SREARPAVADCIAPIDQAASKRPESARACFRSDPSSLRATMTPGTSPFGDMDPEEFRRYAHRVTDWIADYLAHSSTYPVLAYVTPGAIASALPAEAPVVGESFDR